MALRSFAFGVAVCAGLVAVQGEAAFAAEKPMTVTPTSGSVGTVIHVGGNLGSGCGGSALGPELRQGNAFGDPNEWIQTPIAPDGSWSATIVMPSFIGGEAMTQGSLGSDVTPGVWQIDSPLCQGAATSTVDFHVTGTSPVGSRFVGIVSTADGGGYWLVQANGGVFSFGDARFYGSLPSEGIVSSSPIVGITATPDGGGYWLVGADGGVFSFGDARFYGSLPSEGIRPTGVITALTATSNGEGYWLVGADGGVFSFGGAGYFGNARDGEAKVALLPTPDEKGYILPTATGKVAASVGDAGSKMPSVANSPMSLQSLIAGAGATPDDQGYWEVGNDGGVFSVGDARFYGSLPAEGITASAPVLGIATDPKGDGYWLVGADGGVFSFGQAGFYGSAASAHLPW